ncbi:MAG: methyltransferase domain-containing protein, partial [Chloroflexi bacterium]|nr:methyltransferase domain-containing protein [Chloroflexota bacterium]
MSDLQVCRICQEAALVPVLDLGQMALTGVFPQSPGEFVPRTPVELVLCTGCGLAQLGFSADPDVMYGDGYGYRSGLNRSMAGHLRRTARFLERLVALQPGDVVCDIGANDGTLLEAFTSPGVYRLGIDPLVSSVPERYAGELTGVAEFFSADTYWRHAKRPARVVTSIAMLYDLVDPVGFFHDVARVLAPGGVWLSEQSYAPWMVRSGAFDTICQEHLEYYTLTVLKSLLDQAGMHLLSAHTNEINGGSLCFVATPKGADNPPADPVALWLLDQERRAQLTTVEPWLEFAHRARERIAGVRSLLATLQDHGRSVMALGASTKGNVLLQALGEEARYITAIGEINEDKIGRFTPGTGIPITSQSDVIASNPDYILLLPWHFRTTFMEDLTPYLED